MSAPSSMEKDRRSEISKMESSWCWRTLKISWSIRYREGKCVYLYDQDFNKTTQHPLQKIFNSYRNRFDLCLLVKNKQANQKRKSPHRKVDFNFFFWHWAVSLIGHQYKYIYPLWKLQSCNHHNTLLSVLSVLGSLLCSPQSMLHILDRETNQNNQSQKIEQA